MATPKLTLLLSLLILIGAAIAEPTEMNTAFFAQKATLSDCDEVLTSLNGTSTELRQIACTKPATASNETKELSGLSVSGPRCRETPTLNYNDAVALCNAIPNSYSLPPAYRSTCNCEVWYIRTAAWAVCNCDTCSSVDFNSLQGYCRSLVSNCLRAANEGGYYENSQPTAFLSLYGQGGSDPAPIYTECG